MEEEYIRVINITMIGVISWGLIFILIRRIFSNFSFDFSTRIVSTLHATIAVALATHSIQDWSCPVCPIASTSSLRQMETLAFSLSYMIYDLICSHFDQVISIDNAVHHSVCILGFVAGLFYQKVIYILLLLLILEWGFGEINYYYFCILFLWLYGGIVKCGSEMVAALWITEISSPFLHLREILKEIGYRDTDLNLAADVSIYTTNIIFNEI